MRGHCWAGVLEGRGCLSLLSSSSSSCSPCSRRRINDCSAVARSSAVAATTVVLFLLAVPAPPQAGRCVAAYRRQEEEVAQPQPAVRSRTCCWLVHHALPPWSSLTARPAVPAAGRQHPHHCLRRRTTHGRSHHAQLARRQYHSA